METMMMTSNNTGLPKVSLLPAPSIPGRYEFHVEGGTIDPAWTVRPGKTAWCRVTIWVDAHGELEVGSFGGEIWPSAWPQLFQSRDPRALNVTYGSWPKLTDIAKQLFSQHLGVK
jgi:hypothetical protein